MKRQKLSNNFSDQPAEDQPTEDLKNPIARVAVFLIGNAIRIHAEEKLLATRFGEGFAAYCKSVSRLIPFVRL